MVARMRGLGLPFEVLGPAREHWGEARHPVRLDPAHARPGWYAPAAQRGSVRSSAAAASARRTATAPGSRTGRRR
jgi:hypothetical protein